MTFLPIVTRELLVQARRPATYHARVFMALALASIALLVVVFARQDRNLATIIFWLNSSLALGWCLLSGAILTADCLGGEQREGTLGLLFLTDLRSADIVLGKLAATSLQGGFGLLAILPVLALPLLLGGVTQGQFWRLALVLLVTQFTSLCMGALVSSYTTGTRAAVSRVLALLAAQTAGLWFLALLIQRIPLRASRQWARIVGTLNPIETFNWAMTRRLAGVPEPPWFEWGVAVLVLIGLGCLCVAGWRLPRLLHAATPVPASPASRDPRPRPRRSFATGNPYTRLVLRSPGRDALSVVQTIAVIAWSVLFVTTCITGRTPPNAPLLATFLTAYGLHLLAKIRMILEATRPLCEDASSGALELLLSTPLSPAWIVRGATEAFWTRFRSTVWLLTVVNVLLFALMYLGIAGNSSGKDFWASVILFLGGAMLLWLDAAALIPLSLLMALRFQRHVRAVVLTAAWLLVPGWLGLLFLFLIGSTGLSSQSQATFLFAMWFLGNASVAVVLRGVASAELRAFRALASGQRPGADPSLLLWVHANRAMRPRPPSLRLP